MVTAPNSFADASNRVLDRHRNPTLGPLPFQCIPRCQGESTREGKCETARERGFSKGGFEGSLLFADTCFICIIIFSHSLPLPPTTPLRTPICLLECTTVFSFFCEL